MSDPRDQRIAELESRVGAQDAAKDAEIADLKRKVEDLTKMVLMLKERLDRNSGNSGRPPSSDSPDQRSERRGKGATGGKRGGQPGHSGSKRDLLPQEQVNEFKPLFPQRKRPWAEIASPFLPPTVPQPARPARIRLLDGE